MVRKCDIRSPRHVSHPDPSDACTFAMNSQRERKRQRSSTRASSPGRSPSTKPRSMRRDRGGRRRSPRRRRRRSSGEPERRARAPWAGPSSRLGHRRPVPYQCGDHAARRTEKQECDARPQSGVGSTVSPSARAEADQISPTGSAPRAQRSQPPSVCQRPAHDMRRSYTQAVEITDGARQEIVGDEQGDNPDRVEGREGRVRRRWHRRSRAKA